MRDLSLRVGARGWRFARARAHVVIVVLVTVVSELRVREARAHRGLDPRVGMQESDISKRKAPGRSSEQKGQRVLRAAV